MKNKFSKLAVLAAVATPLVAGGCSTLNNLSFNEQKKDERVVLSSNTFNNSQEGRVNSNEDKINFQKVGILDNNYFVVPLNKSTIDLRGGEPSFALIPEEEARITVTNVGVPGGKVKVDAPEGGIYFPYAYDSNQTLSLNFANQKPVRFATNFKLSDLVKPDKNQGKISISRMTEQNLPFSDESLKVIDNQRYLVNRAGDINHQSVLPIYFTELPISIEYDRTEKDGKMRMRGETYVFQKGESMEGYLTKRGYSNPVKEREDAERKAKVEQEKARKNIQTIKVNKKK